MWQPLRPSCLRPTSSLHLTVFTNGQFQHHQSLPTLRSRSPCASWAPLHRGLVRGSFPAPHHHDPNETLPNFQILGHGGCTWLKSVCTLILTWCHSSTHVPSRSKFWRSSMKRWRLCTFLLIGGEARFLERALRLHTDADPTSHRVRLWRGGSASKVLLHRVFFSRVRRHGHPEVCNGPWLLFWSRGERRDCAAGGHRSSCGPVCSQFAPCNLMFFP